MKPFVVAANWKMHKSPVETVSYFEEFLPKIEGQADGREIIFFVPAVDILTAQERLRGTGIHCGSQNSHFEMKGAFTGETSPLVLKELGITYGLVGHSERRALFHETDWETGKKLRALQQVGISPVLCVGETLQERKAGQTAEVIVGQLQAGLKEADLADFDGHSGLKLCIAYEPVWAIGTGQVATPQQANEAHVVLRQALIDRGGPEFARRALILYGGSVKPENAREIAVQVEVDGFLVGGASLEPSSFLPLCLVEKH